MECMQNHFRGGVVLDGRYETISALNHGSFGMVFLAKDLSTADLVALKCLTKSSAAGACPSSFVVDENSEELAIHSRIGTHSNIVNLLHHFETKSHIYLVLEYCANGDLYEAIRLQKGPLETEHVRSFMLQLVSAVEHMHSKGVYHRDIKPENIFLTQDGSMKLGDFGLATTDEWSYEAAVGSDRYMAPEQYDPADNGYSPAAADIWAIGICLLNVLFSKNPFATPSFSDPLFTDFAGDRQTLFDVFPNMSQDTYEVLGHCLVIDPAKRSLSAVREAIERAVSFTIDDESLDDFCTEEREPVVATANREPLRTPSISTPQVDNGSFPWAKALAMSPPQAIRQLSAIPDTEDLFPGSVRSTNQWCIVKPDNASIVSFVDSGLGVSLDSSDGATNRDSFEDSCTKPMPIAGSLPINVSRPSMSSVFGKKRDMVSKSWSDLWDEEEEELAELGHSFRESSLHSKAWRHEEGGSGMTTPRPSFVELNKDPATINNIGDYGAEEYQPVDDRVNEHTGFVFEEHQAVPVQRYSPPSKRSILDKWAALGNRRRSPATPAPQAPPATPQKQAAPKPTTAPASARKRNQASGWRRHINWGEHTEKHSFTIPHNHSGNDSSVTGTPHSARKDNWSLSKDWRQHPNFFSSSNNRHNGRKHAAAVGLDGNVDVDDDIGDLEWVGGWDNFHL